MVNTQARQATKASIHFSESLELVHQMVQVGVSQICSSRNFLPSDDFEDVKIPGLEGLETKMLRSGEDASNKANALMAWLAEGFKAALDDGYVSKLILGLSSDPECRCILEEYIFQFETDAMGNITLTLGDDAKGAKGRTNRASKPNINTARTQVVKLIRTVVAVTRTLDNIPKENTIFMKIEFNEDCPEDYEPPHFEPAGDRAVGFFATKPFSLPLGSLTTPYHSLQLGVRSLLDSVDVIPGKGPMADDVSRWDTTFITGDDNKSATRRAKKEEDGSQRMITGTEDMDDLFPAEPVHATKAHTAGVSSLAGGIHTQPGTEVTLSVDGHADAEEPLDEQQGRDADVVMQDIGMQNDVANTQASEFINRRDRKVSIVQRPIVQQFKRTAKPENKVVGPKEADEENPAPKGRAGLRPKRAAAGQRGPRRS